MSNVVSQVAADEIGATDGNALKILLREADHRVTNSLQLLSGLLLMQEKTLTDGMAREALADTRRRIGCIARLHRSLCSSIGSDAVVLDEYLRSLSDDLWGSFLDGRRIQFLVNADPITVSAQVACSIGLTVNELVTNAIKHGFGDDDVGIIEISCGADKDGNIHIEVSNDAAIIEPARTISLDGCSGLGTKIVKSLLGQHKGKLDTMIRGRKTVQRILLPTS